jgi:hypothetical protein
VDTYGTPLKQQFVVEFSAERESEYDFIGQGGPYNSQNFVRTENSIMLETWLRLGM